jgi:preprotein translocase subunit SecE
MSANVETSGFSSLDKTKLWLAVAIAVAGLVAFYWLEGRQSIWARSGILIGGFVVAGVLIAFSAFGSFLKEFVVESHFELRKIVWPTRQETLQTTLVIFVVVLIISLMLFAFDSILGFIFRWLFSADWS